MPKPDIAQQKRLASIVSQRYDVDKSGKLEASEIARMHPAERELLLRPARRAKEVKVEEPEIKVEKPQVVEVEKPQAEVEELNIIQKYDLDKSGKLEYEELKQLYKENPQLAQQLLGEDFNKFEEAIKIEELDATGDKRLDLSDFDYFMRGHEEERAREVLKALGLDVTLDEAKKLYIAKSFDSDRSGKLEYEERKALVRYDPQVAKEILGEEGYNETLRQIRLEALDLTGDKILDYRDVDKALQYGDLATADKILKELGAGITAEEYQKQQERAELIQAYDFNKSGTLEFEELKQLYETRPKLVEEILGTDFKQFETSLKIRQYDVNKSGKLEYEELQKMYEENPELARKVLGEEGFKELEKALRIQQYDINKSGKLEYDELVKMYEENPELAEDVLGESYQAFEERVKKEKKVLEIYERLQKGDKSAISELFGGIATVTGYKLDKLYYENHVPIIRVYVEGYTGSEDLPVPINRWYFITPHYIEEQKNPRMPKVEDVQILPAEVKTGYFMAPGYSYEVALAKAQQKGVEEALRVVTQFITAGITPAENFVAKVYQHRAERAEKIQSYDINKSGTLELEELQKMYKEDSQLAKWVLGGSEGVKELEKAIKISSYDVDKSGKLEFEELKKQTPSQVSKGRGLAGVIDEKTRVPVADNKEGMIEDSVFDVLTVASPFGGALGALHEWANQLKENPTWQSYEKFVEDTAYNVEKKIEETLGYEGRITKLEKLQRGTEGIVYDSALRRTVENELNSISKPEAPHVQVVKGVGDVLVGTVAMPKLVVDLLAKPVETGSAFVQAATNEPIRFGAAIVGGVLLGKALPRAYNTLPAKPAVTRAVIGESKAYSVGILLQKGAYTEYKPLISFARGSEGFPVSRWPNIDVAKALPSIKKVSGQEVVPIYLPRSPFETGIVERYIAKTSPSELPKITEARAVRKITVKSDLSPKEFKPTVEEVLERHNIPKKGEVADVIIETFKEEEAKVYGSAVQKAAAKEVGEPGLARAPKDFDVTVKNPEGFAKKVAERINKAVGEEVVVAEGNSVKVKATGDKLFDIHKTEDTSYIPRQNYLGWGLKAEKTAKTSEGVKVIRLSEQASRKLRGAVTVAKKLVEHEVGIGNIADIVVGKESVKVKGQLVPEYAGRVKDIADYYMAEMANIMRLEMKGKTAKAAEARTHLENWLESWGEDVAQTVRKLYTKAKEQKVELADFSRAEESMAKSYGRVVETGSFSSAVEAGAGVARAGGKYIGEKRGYPYTPTAKTPSGYMASVEKAMYGEYPPASKKSYLSYPKQTEYPTYKFGDYVLRELGYKPTSKPKKYPKSQKPPEYPSPGYPSYPKRPSYPPFEYPKQRKYPIPTELPRPKPLPYQPYKPPEYSVISYPPDYPSYKPYEPPYNPYSPYEPYQPYTPYSPPEYPKQPEYPIYPMLRGKQYDIFGTFSELFYGGGRKRNPVAENPFEVGFANFVFEKMMGGDRKKRGGRK